MGRKPLSKAMRLKRILTEYPELALMPPNKYRTCDMCWFMDTCGCCPFTGEKVTKPHSVAECVRIVKQWNTNALRSNPTAYEEDVPVEKVMHTWNVSYVAGTASITEPIEAVSAVSAMGILMQKVPYATINGVAIVEEPEATE